jgi:hypothetical protein
MIMIMIMIIIIIISGSTVLERTLSASRQRFRNLFKTVRLLCTGDQPVAKVCTYTGQQNINTKRKSMPRTEFEPTIPVTKRPRPTPYAGTGTGPTNVNRVLNRLVADVTVA